MTDHNETTLAAMRAAAPVLHGGTYTITHDERGHYTVKVHTVQNGKLAGKRIISLLAGPDNENDYRGVAFWDDQKRRAFVWKKYASDADLREWPLDGNHWPKAYNAIERRITVFLSLAVVAPSLPEGKADYWTREGYRLERASRCVVCNRTLTTPQSLELGIGPVCAERVGAGASTKAEGGVA